MISAREARYWLPAPGRQCPAGHTRVRARLHQTAPPDNPADKTALTSMLQTLPADWIRNALTKRVSMRPRVITRGKALGAIAPAADRLASMRPRVISRGKLTAVC